MFWSLLHPLLDFSIYHVSLVCSVSTPTCCSLSPSWCVPHVFDLNLFSLLFWFVVCILLNLVSCFYFIVCFWLVCSLFCLSAILSLAVFTSLVSFLPISICPVVWCPVCRVRCFQPLSSAFVVPLFCMLVFLVLLVIKDHLSYFAACVWVFSPHSSLPPHDRQSQHDRELQVTL